MWQSVKRAFSTWFWGERISKGKIRVIILDQIGLFVVSLSKSQETRARVCVRVFQEGLGGHPFSFCPLPLEKVGKQNRPKLSFSISNTTVVNSSLWRNPPCGASPSRKHARAYKEPAIWSNWASNKGKSIKISPVSSLARDLPKKLATVTRKLDPRRWGRFSLLPRVAAVAPPPYR